MWSHLHDSAMDMSNNFQCQLPWLHVSQYSTTLAAAKSVPTQMQPPQLPWLPRQILDKFWSRKVTAQAFSAGHPMTTMVIFLFMNCAFILNKFRNDHNWDVIHLIKLIPVVEYKSIGTLNFLSIFLGCAPSNDGDQLRLCVALFCRNSLF